MQSHNQDEIRQMELEISSMEYELNERYSEFGKAILEIAEKENRRLNRLVDRIVEARQRLSEARGEKFCPECAKANDHDSNYCKRCGRRLDKEDKHGAE